MASILHLRKPIASPPACDDVVGITVRNIVLPDDINGWLTLRERAIAGLSPRPRSWLHADYAAEMFDKPWFHADRNWIAVGDESPNQPIGSVTLALREGQARTAPVVHWLLVDPKYRRRGVASMLMSHLEHAAWDGGHREVELETHSDWSAALAFYQAIGFKARD